jgi:hypothetical protein
MNEPCFFCSLAAQPRTIEQDGQCALDADQARQALRTTGAWQKADQGLRKTKSDFRIVDENAVMCAERQFTAAAQRQSLNGCRDGLARALQCANGKAQSEEVIKSEVEASRARSGDDHFISPAKLTQIRARAEGIALPRPYQQAGYICCLKPFGDAAQLFDGGLGEHIHCPSGTVEDEVSHAIVGYIQSKLL